MIFVIYTSNIMTIIILQLLYTKFKQFESAVAFSPDFNSITVEAGYALFDVPIRYFAIPWTQHGC